MRVGSIKRPWSKKTSQGNTYTDTSFYRSTAWRKTRAAFLRANPYCECDDCAGKHVPADMVDHRTPIELGGDKFDWNNLQAMRNHPCHDRKRAREKNAKYAKRKQ